MTALCPECNLKKGAKMLRSHQQDVEEIAIRIRGGRPIKKIIVRVTPGGGKSWIPSILMKHLIPTIADRLCWLVPQVSLQKQGAQDSETLRSVLSVPHYLRASSNEYPLVRNRGCAGYVTCYQSIVAAKNENSRLHYDEFSKHKYILVLDEPHHIEEQGTYYRAVEELVDKAVLLVLMSGTLARGDGQKIAFLDYENGKPLLVDSENTAIVEYSRSAALQGKAIIPLQFAHDDGQLSWIPGDGTDAQSISSFEEVVGTSEKRQRAALFTALNTDYAYDLLNRCVTHWKHHQKNTKSEFPNAPPPKLLVVAQDIRVALDYYQKLLEWGVHCEIATSDDSSNAHETIKRFRNGNLACLVTVAMAYEGLDVKDISHIAALTYYRSTPWIEQMVTRGVRVARGIPYESQVAYIFCPDDPMLNSIIETIKLEQVDELGEREAHLIEVLVKAISTGTPIEGIDWEAIHREFPDIDPKLIERKVEEGKESPPPSPPGTGRIGPDIIPLDGKYLRERSSDIRGESLTFEEHERALTAMEEAGIHGISPLRFIKAKLVYEERPVAVSKPIPTGPSLTSEEIERKLRKDIQRHAASAARRSGRECADINGEICNHFGKSRTKMGLEELQKVREWIAARYPNENHHT